MNREHAHDRVRRRIRAPARRRWRSRSWAAPLLIAALGSAATLGCRSTPTRFEILSFRRPQAPERLSERFDPGSFAVNARGNWDIVFEIPPTLIVLGDPEIAARGETTEGAAAPSPPTADREVWMSQIILVNVFWRPRPGKTHAESTQTDATILYNLMTGGEVIAYEGAGFVYFKQSRDGMTIKGRIESSDLTPQRHVNRPDDLFGPCRIRGTFTARKDRKHVVSILKKLRRRLGPRVSSQSDAEKP